VKSILIGDFPVAYMDRGEGPAVVMIHCSSASHRMWTRLADALDDRYRVLAPDLIGYGLSAGWPADRPFRPMADLETVQGLAALAEGTVHLVAHSYGGVVALEAARLLGARIKSLTLIEPVAFHLLRLAGRTAEWDEISGVARRVRSAADRGALRSAAAIYMSFWIGRLRWWAMPGRRKRDIVGTVQKVAWEFGQIDQAPAPLEAYREIRVPTRLIVGGRTRRPARAVIEVVDATLPDAHVVRIAGAGHMSPFTHAAEVRRLVVEHVDAA
jgi:lipase